MNLAVSIAVSYRVVPAMRLTAMPSSRIEFSTAGDRAAVPPISTTWRMPASLKYDSTLESRLACGLNSTG